ncbi:DMT family transporter [Rickettsiales endosymbiont of Stachyamoeba lipophora]|uniref:DMT family transporter n=1 Tax=Rickettsiales endosymbiont of Stachyamoeba lipophora TaxID=2486578 RepID=UPI000F64E9B4|nr:DMT family transporter [Rickettsiales endosymbiont of Stachyamoeba lipophora]AZL16171.1 DMT family transporter [Rickettsiales endosymbiont of Stachyamoeba lipophora]
MNKPTKRIYNRDQTIGIIFVILSLIFYAFSDALIKYFFKNYQFGIAQVTFLRSLGRIVPLIAFSLIAYTKTFSNPLKTNKILYHLANSIIGCGRTFAYIYAFSVMPLAESSSLSYTSAIFFAILATIFLNEKLKRYHLWAVILATIGIIIALRPGIDNMLRFGAVIVLLGSLLAAISKILIKKLTVKDDPLAIIFYPNILLLIVTAPFLINNWVPLDKSSALLFVLVGFLAAIGQYFYAMALKYASALTIAPYDYSYLIWILLTDFLFNSNFPDLTSIIGGLFVVISNILILAIELKRQHANKKTRIIT